MDRQLHPGSNSRLKGGLRNSLAALLALVLATSACGAPGQGDEDSGPGVPGPGDEDHEPGVPGQRLLVQGGGIVQTLRLSGTPGWHEELTFTERAALPAVNASSSQFHLARTVAADEFTVETYSLNDLTTVTSGFSWPETDNSSFFAGLAFSPDGSYAAAVKRHVGEDELSIISLDGGQATPLAVHDFRGEIGADLAWLDDETLVFHLDVSSQTDGPVADYAGAIVSLDVPGSVQNGSPQLNIMAGFSADRWTGLSSVGYFAVSPDGQRLVYSYGPDGSGDLWVRGTQPGSSGPVQLTSGRHPHLGAAFSPDGRSLAFVEYMAEYASNVFVIPSEPGSIVNLDDEAVR